MSIELIESFTGTCRNITYNYRYMRVNNELILESYNDTGLVDSLTWYDNSINDRLIKAAIADIKARG